jgi:hypothetical protein
MNAANLTAIEAAFAPLLDIPHFDAWATERKVGIVAYGVHPGTGWPYAWPDDDLLNLERNNLPELTAEKAVRIVGLADGILARIGITSATRSTGRAQYVRRPGPEPRPVRDLGEARRVLDVLKSIDPSGLDYDTWVASGYGVKAALGEHGREAWIAWSSRSAKHGASGRSDTPARVWSSIRPERCGWRYLERLLCGGHGHG